MVESIGQCISYNNFRENNPCIAKTLECTLFVFAIIAIAAIGGSQGWGIPLSALKPLLSYKWMNIPFYAIGGAGLGNLMALGAIFLGIYLFCRWRKKQKPLQKEQILIFEEKMPQILRNLLHLDTLPIQNTYDTWDIYGEGPDKVFYHKNSVLKARMKNNILFIYKAKTNNPALGIGEGDEVITYYDSKTDTIQTQQKAKALEQLRPKRYQSHTILTTLEEYKNLAQIELEEFTVTIENEPPIIKINEFLFIADLVT